MATYRRIFIPGGIYFFTVGLADRKSSLLTDNIALLRTAFQSVRAAHSFGLDAIVVLPDHLHCLWRMPEGDDDYPMRWRQIKSAFSRALPGAESRSRSRSSKNERGIWQRRYWEHVIRDESDCQNHLNYIHYNPVKHGLVQRVSDWPWSSFARYVRLGIYPPDWGNGIDEPMGNFGE